MATLIGICKKDEEKFMDMFEQLKDHVNLRPGGLPRDVVYLGSIGWPIASSYMSPNAGGGGSSVLGGELRLAGSQPKSTAQINFGDLTPYLTYAWNKADEPCYL